MKSLLIHSNNTSALNLFSENETALFSSNDREDMDFQLTDFIERVFSKGSFSGIFIKASLSKNYLEFLGLRLALHIRFSSKFPDVQKVPIIIIAEENYEELARLSSNTEFLFSEGIYLTTESPTRISDILDKLANNLLRGCSSFEKFVGGIHISPPSNYLSHHSISNEWSILRWAQVLGVPDGYSPLDSVKKNVGSLLYYKFLQTKFPTSAEVENPTFSITGNGKILFIDDEWDKGWTIVLKKLIPNPSNISLETVSCTFKDKLADDIVVDCKNETLRVNPDIVLLDLRLSDSDFSSSAITSDLTGYKVLNAIKTLNPGIQVFIFTASNKVWNLLELQAAGADGFILKEAPELSIDINYSRNIIERITHFISEGLKMAFLKEVFLSINAIELSAIKGESVVGSEFIDRLKTNLSISFKLLNEARKSTKYFNYAYLQLFQIIEDFVSLPSVFKDEGSDKYVVVKNKEVLIQRKLRNKTEYALTFDSGKYKIQRSDNNQERNNGVNGITNFKVSAILIFRLGFENSSELKWTKIYTTRNTKAAHFNADAEINKEHIFLLLDFIQQFIDVSNQNEANINKGLNERTYDESLEILKGRYNQ